MAVYSMTGYGSAVSGVSEGTAGAAGVGSGVTVELRSVNGRYLDLSLRLPEDLRGLEPALRELVAAQCRRGKIELRVATPRDAETGLPQPDPDQLNRLARIEATVLSIDDVTKWFDRLWSLPMAQRGRIVGLPPEKADVILAGVAIYQEIIVRPEDLVTMEED
jgi:hypothetical protein